ncbi:hypothetical protein OAF01_02090, partial [bacterium]|nr:hypothetical protein [bacterium]
CCRGRIVLWSLGVLAVFLVVFLFSWVLGDPKKNRPSCSDHDKDCPDIVEEFDGFPVSWVNGVVLDVVEVSYFFVHSLQLEGEVFVLRERINSLLISSSLKEILSFFP